MNAFFLLTAHDQVAHLQLNQPARANSLAPLFFPALRDAVRGLQEAGHTRALVISSSGAQFSAGFSLDVYTNLETPPPAPRTDRRDPRESIAREAVGAVLAMLGEQGASGGPLALQTALRHMLGCFNVLEEAPFPVICAVQGGCVGAALDLACACDIRLCTADAYFTPDEHELGMAAEPAVLQRLRALIPAGAARELAFTGARIDATRAHELGLVNTVLPDVPALLSHALALAGRIAAKSPLAVAGAKAALSR
jgi:enoyl-CoA hydratase